MRNKGIKMAVEMKCTYAHPPLQRKIDYRIEEIPTHLLGCDHHPAE